MTKPIEVETRGLFIDRPVTVRWLIAHYGEHTGDPIYVLCDLERGSQWVSTYFTDDPATDGVQRLVLPKELGA